MDEEEMQKRLDWYDKKYGPYIDKRGMNNWRNLFKRPNMYELTIFLMIFLTLFMGWAYKHDVQACQACLYRESEAWNLRMNNSQPSPIVYTNFSELNITFVAKEDDMGDIG